MNLILISYPEMLEGETACVVELFNNGLELFHLRKPDVDIDLLRNYLRQIPLEYHNRIVLHSCFELMVEFSLKGIHTKQTGFQNSYPVVSASLHTIDELNKFTNQFEYVFLSPVFNSTSKPGYLSSFEFKSLSESLKQFKQSHSTKVIALGGITNENMSTAIDLGFDGAAVLGFIWECFISDQSDQNVEGVVKRYNKLKEICQSVPQY